MNGVKLWHGDMVCKQTKQITFFFSSMSSFALAVFLREVFISPTENAFNLFSDMDCRITNWARNQFTFANRRDGLTKIYFAARATTFIDPGLMPSWARPQGRLFLSFLADMMAAAAVYIFPSCLANGYRPRTSESLWRHSRNPNIFRNIWQELSCRGRSIGSQPSIETSGSNLLVVLIFM